MNTDPIIFIDSHWKVIKARWDKIRNEYFDYTTEEFDKIIQMEITDNGSGMILKFIGGPTGYESYYISDLDLHHNILGEFCICAGTINSWPSCTVETQQVINFLQLHSSK